ncbi:MAG: PLDc N-terminal domain-containing protein [Caldisericia bacterium]|nr:PLDc N-terminal domain-containing protein [Caldisericia bacterium]MDD4614304.1 PLDc N-terminal domain-containing protein [Caldisericia bacterium]
MNMTGEIGRYMALLWPIVVIQLILQIYSLVDLFRRSQVPTNNKLLWGLVIVLGGFLGSIVYLLLRDREG